MNGIKAFIFDLDGVICYTDEYHYYAWKKLADELGIPFNRRINNRLRGVSRMESLEIILEKSNEKYTDEEKAALAKRKNDIYVGLLENLTEEDASQDVRRTLHELKRRGYKIAVGSSSKNTPYILERLGLADWFDAVSDGNNVTRSKPDPEVFLKAAQMLGLSPKECAVVEDAFSGIDAGAAGGFTTIAIGDAAQYDKADYKIKEVGDILTLI